MSRTVPLLGLILPLGLLGFVPQAPAPVPDAKVADAITLKDGKVILGEVAEAPPRSAIRVIVRREWARKNLPELAASWEKTEELGLKGVRRSRVDRLTRWRAERPGDDPVGRRIDLELAKARDAAAKSPLMSISIDRSKVRQTIKADATGRVARRMAWIAGLANPEERTTEELKTALQSRGLLVNPANPGDLSPLLPDRAETDVEWLGRRASTEVLHDPGLRLIQYGSFVLPEPGAGEGIRPDQFAGVVESSLRSILGDGPTEDPLKSRFLAIERKGRVGAVVTRWDGAENGRGGVKVTCALWIRGPQGWFPALWRAASLSPAALPENAGNDLLDDPQISAIFRMVDAMGAGTLDPAIKRQAIATGEATRRALGAARSSVQKELERRDLLAIETFEEKGAPK